MRRFGFLFFFTLILIWPSLGQFQTVDSLLKVVESASTPIIKLRALNELAWEQKSTDPDAATAHVREAMRLARSLNNEAEIGKSFKIMGILHWYASDMKACRTKLDSALMYFQRINDRKGEADVINNLALSYHVSGDLGQAGILYQKTLDIRKEIQDREGMISNHNNLGVLFFDLGMYPDALASYQEALALMQQTGDQSKLGNAYLNIGNIHFKQKSHEEAMKAFQKALDVFEQDQDLRSMADAYVNMGQVADALGKPDEAEQHYRMSLRFFEEVEDQLGISENLRNVGNMLSNQEAGKEALPLIQKSLKISQDIGDLPGVVKASIDLARHYQQQNQLVLASSQLDQAVHIATQQEMRPELIEAYDLLASIYAKQGRYEDAYRFAGREEALEDSMYTLEQARTFSFQSAKMDLTTKKLENANLIKDIKLAETQASAQRMKFTLALTIATAIGVLAILLFETNRKKTRQNIVLQDQNHRIRMQKAQIEAQNEELEDKNGQLKKLDQEKNDLMGMVAHDLKNPISQIKGLVDIIQMENEKMSEQQLKFLGMIGGTSDRLNNMIHRLLDARAVEKAEIKLHLQEVDLADMMEEVRIDFSMRAAEKRIQLVYEQPDFQHLVNVDPDYTRQILDNILSNALKFSPFDKNIYLVLKRKGDQIYAGIQDEGPGITPEDMKKLFGKFQKLSARPTNGESSSGLGLSIVKRFAEEMGGTVWAESDPGQGATFWVRFPAVEVLA